jgi:hypothetical protein
VRRAFLHRSARCHTGAFSTSNARRFYGDGSDISNARTDNQPPTTRDPAPPLRNAKSCHFAVKPAKTWPFSLDFEPFIVNFGLKPAIRESCHFAAKEIWLACGREEARF